MPTMFAQIGVEHARNYGTTFEQFAKVSVKNHHHSTMNAKSMYRVETPLEEVMGSEMISYPNTKLMCSVNVDGSAAAVLASEATAKRLGLMDRAVKVRASEMSSNPFEARQLAMPDFSAATRLAARNAYEQAGVGAEDIDLVELNEAFSAQSIACIRMLGLDAEKVNVQGGAIAIGHPLGASGARIATTLVHAMQRTDVELGLATMCIGVGQGIATVLERV